MRTGVVEARIHAAATSGHATLTTLPNQALLNDWRLRGFAATVLGGAWAAPTTVYSIVADAGLGDHIEKGGVPWNLGYQDLGHNTPVTLPDGTTDATSPVSSVALSVTEDLICFYANHLLNDFYTGVYVMRVKDDGAGHIYWGDPIPVPPLCDAIDDLNALSQFFVTFPRLQVINGEYWILALEASRQSNIITYHLCYFHSSDGEHWSDREYLVGVSNDPAETNVGINSHLVVGTPTPFVLNNLRHAYLYIDVAGMYCYIVSKLGASNFRCPATTLVGVTNPSLQQDLTADILSRNPSTPAAPSAMQGNYPLFNSAGKYNAHPLLVPGAQIISKAGYNSDLITIGTELIDETRQVTAVDANGVAQNALALQMIDLTGYLRDWFADTFIEYDSPKQAVYDLLCDFTGLTLINQAGFSIDNSANLRVNMIDPNSPTPDNLAFIHVVRTVNGMMELQWRITQSLTDHYVYISLQGTEQCNDYYAVVYDGNSQTFQLWRATPSTQPYKILEYGASLQTSGVVALNPDVDYWLRAAQFHNRVVAWHSSDRITWTKVIDYAGVTANKGYWGLGGKATGLIAPAIGNSDAYGGAQPLYSGANPIMVALRVQTGAFPSSLIALGAIVGQTGNPGNLVIGLGADNGAGTYPANLTNDANVVWRGELASTLVSDPLYPAWGPAVGPDTDVELATSTYFWVYLTFEGTLGVGQVWDWFTQDPDTLPYGSGLTKVSTDGGATWSDAASSVALAALLFVAYDYGHPRFASFYWSSGEMPRDLEYIAKAIAAQASILTATPDSFLVTADLVLGGDSILWQPTVYGMLGDFTLDADGVIDNGWVGEVLFRASAIGGGVGNGYRVRLIPATQKIEIYEPSAVLALSVDSLQYIPVGVAFHLTLVNWAKWIYIYINGCLATTCYNENLTTLGYFGLLHTHTAWTNVRIPDMLPIKPLFNINANANALTALADLFAKTKYRYFIRYDGSLRMGSFPNRTSVATYSATLTQAEKVETARYAFSHLRAQGGQYADRFSAAALDKQGRRRFQVVDFTSSFSNEDAYRDSDLALRQAAEKDSQLTMDMYLVDFCLEREDRITVVDPSSGVSADYVVNDIAVPQLQVSPKPSAAGQVGLRKFVT
jgi:hypothetical protein